MQRPLYGLATELTPFEVAGPPLDGVSAAVVSAPSHHHVVAATAPFAAAAPRMVRTDAGPRVVLVQQRDEAIVLKVALIGGLAMTLAWMVVAAHRPDGSSAARSLPAVPDANTTVATSAPEVNRLVKPVRWRIERPASGTNTTAASAPARASEPRRDVPTEPLTSTLERLRAGLP